MRQAVRLLGVPKNIHKSFRRALDLAGAGSQSAWILTQIRKFIRQQQEKFGEDLFQVLTEEEKDLLKIVASGAAEIQHIAQESLLSEAKVTKLIDALIDCGFIEEKRKGGKTDQARGAVIKYYFVTKKYTDLVE